MVDEPLYIEKDNASPEGLQYYALRKLGIRYLQEMSGTVWTDYNEHDPGVTMLEQFCYALTSLTYLTETPLRDLLADKLTGRIDMERQALFIPKDIYPCNPWTATDYRKLVLDQMARIGNAWFVPYRPPANGPATNGLYTVLLYIPDSAGHPHVGGEIKTLYAGHRSLCEDLQSVHVLKNKPMQLYADISFNDGSSPEWLLARIFFEVNQYMAPEVRRYTLEETLARGLTPDEIFQGPLLRNGFIADEALQPKSAALFMNKVEKAMLGIPGIENIKNVYLKNGQEVLPRKIEVPEDTVWTLDTRPDPGGSFKVRCYKKGVEYKPDPVRVQRELNKLYQDLRLRYRLDLQYEKFFGVPPGQYKPVEKYYSIQNQFPIVYGINKFGLLRSDPPDRKAKARQLKGYLLLFEQLMANFQAQLAHVRDLFSIDPEVRHTYFYQSLEEIVPDIKPVLKKGREVPGIPDDPDCGGYKNGLKKLIDSMDPYWDRRNRFLDFLLALYGERISEYSLSPYETCCSDQPLPERLIRAKLLFLKYLVTSTRDRGRAFNYLDTKAPVNIPGMEGKIRILLGMPVHPLIYLEEAFSTKGFRMVGAGDEKMKKLMPPTATPAELIGSQYEPIESYQDPEGSANREQRESATREQEEIRPEYDAEARQKLLRTMPLYKEGLADEDFIAGGTELNNYRIGQDKAAGNWELVFRHQQTAPWKTLGRFSSREEGSAAAFGLSDTVKELCCFINRLHIVEHNLLRYALRQDDHSFTLPDYACGNKSNPGSFPYSFHISVFFSGSSSLIANAGYRTFAEKTVAENTPAHIIADFYWLAPWQMLLFEILLIAWRYELATPERNPALLAALSRDMILFLQECRDNKRKR